MGNKSGEGKQIGIWSLPANPVIPGGKQPGTTQSGKNPPGLLQLICFQIPSNNLARLDHESTFNEAIESMVFQLCDADSNEGLSWEEVKACDGKYLQFYQSLALTKRILIPMMLTKMESLLGLNGNLKQNNKETKNGWSRTKVNHDMAIDRILPTCFNLLF